MDNSLWTADADSPFLFDWIGSDSAPIPAPESQEAIVSADLAIDNSAYQDESHLTHGAEVVGSEPDQAGASGGHDPVDLASMPQTYDFQTVDKLDVANHDSISGQPFELPEFQAQNLNPSDIWNPEGHQEQPSDHESSPDDHDGSGTASAASTDAVDSTAPTPSPAAADNLTEHTGAKLADVSTADAPGGVQSHLVIAISEPIDGLPIDTICPIDDGAGGADSGIPIIDIGGTDGSGLDNSGSGSYDYNGYWSASAGDVNGDGFDDAVISAYSYSSGVYSSSIYVVFGTADGTSPPPDPAALDGSNGFRINDGESDGYRPSVTAAGDINGDGFADLIVASYGADGSPASFVVFGNSAGFGGETKTSDLNGGNGFQIEDSAANGSTSLWVDTVGDVNNDGLADLLVQTFGADADGNWIDASYIIFGTAGGFDTALDIALLDGTDGFKIEDTAASDTGAEGTPIGDVIDIPIDVKPLPIMVLATDIPV